MLSREAKPTSEEDVRFVFDVGQQGIKLGIAHHKATENERLRKLEMM